MPRKTMWTVCNMLKKPYEPIRVDCLKNRYASSIRFKDVKEAEKWITLAKMTGLIHDAEIVLDIEGASK